MWFYHVCGPSHFLCRFLPNLASRDKEPLRKGFIDIQLPGAKFKNFSTQLSKEREQRVQNSYLNEKFALSFRKKNQRKILRAF